MKYLTEAYTFQTLYGTGLEASKSVRTQYRPNYSEVNFFVFVCLLCYH